MRSFQITTHRDLLVVLYLVCHGTKINMFKMQYCRLQTCLKCNIVVFFFNKIIIIVPLNNFRICNLFKRNDIALNVFTSNLRFTCIFDEKVANCCSCKQFDNL
jgi:hypothetical protein